MGVTAVAQTAAVALVSRAFGLADDEPVEHLVASAVRRAASITCPTTAAALSAAVTNLLAPLIASDELSEVVRQTVDQLAAVGDLVEYVDDTSVTRRTVLYLGHPRFVLRATGDVLLLGVRPDGVPLVSEDLSLAVERHGLLRRLPRQPELPELLAAEGLHEVNASRWLRAPDVTSPEALMAAYDDRLDRQGPSGEIDGLRILDSATSPLSYRARWRVPSDHSGRFVARRPQRYGSDLWSYVALEQGRPTHLLDLPALTHDRGCDEAWRIQAAIDCRNEKPQQIVVGGTGQGRVALGLFAPPPRWLQRRWEFFGNAGRLQGALFAYEFATTDVMEELQFATKRLWLSRRMAD